MLHMWFIEFCMGGSTALLRCEEMDQHCFMKLEVQLRHGTIHAFVNNPTKVVTYQRFYGGCIQWGTASF